MGVKGIVFGGINKNKELDLKLI